MRKMDTIDKIVTTYMAGVCRKQFHYKGTTYIPLPVHVSPLLLRGFTCPAQCGACCGNFTLDYLPSEVRPRDIAPRYITIHDRSLKIYSDVQGDNPGPMCRNVDLTSGRCRIYTMRPFACDFELIRVMRYSHRIILTQKLYGRAWAMRRVDDARGTLCEMLPPTLHTVSEVRRKMQRLSQWSEYLGIETCLDSILEWIDSGDHAVPLELPI